MVSDVYYSGMRCKGPNETVVHKLRRLFDSSGIAQTISKGDLVAVKIHLGTGGNQRHIRPQHVRVIVEKVKEAGGKPFVTDTTGIGLTSENGTAESMLRNAAARGFVQEVVGASIIVADAPKGLQGTKVRVDGLRFKEVALAPAIAECDSLISVAHAKGHPRTGIAASLKNLGLGCVTKCGKAPIHLAKKPSIDLAKCNDCGVCIAFCPVGAIVRVSGRPKIIQDQCVWGCGCWTICPTEAISKWIDMNHPSNEEMILREIDAVKATVDQIGPDKCGFFNLAYDVTPHCDCAPYGDVPMVPDVGMFASKDPVACDMATADAIINSPGIPGSAAEELNVMARGSDKFLALTDWPPFSDFKKQGGTKYWRSQFDAASRLGIGSREYRLIEL
jgi:uncharacterized Fe-S center protein